MVPLLRNQAVLFGGVCGRFGVFRVADAVASEHIPSVRCGAILFVEFAFVADWVQELAWSAIFGLWHVHTLLKVPDVIVVDWLQIIADTLAGVSVPVLGAFVFVLTFAFRHTVTLALVDVPVLSEVTLLDTNALAAAACWVEVLVNAAKDGCAVTAACHLVPVKAIFADLRQAVTEATLRSYMPVLASTTLFGNANERARAGVPLHTFGHFNAATKRHAAAFATLVVPIVVFWARIGLRLHANAFAAFVVPRVSSSASASRLHAHAVTVDFTPEKSERTNLRSALAHALILVENFIVAAGQLAAQT